MQAFAYEIIHASPVLPFETKQGRRLLDNIINKNEPHSVGLFNAVTSCSFKLELVPNNNCCYSC